MNRDTNSPIDTTTGKCWALIETRKSRQFGRMGNIKKVQNREYYLSEESRQEMNMENPKRWNEKRN